MLEKLRAWWPFLRRALAIVFFVLVVILLILNARKIEWSRVLDAIRSYEAATLLLAVLCAAGGHLALSSFDLLGRTYTGHDVSVPRTMAIGFVTYAFVLNLSALVGGVGFRYRLYSRVAVGKADITRIYSLSLLTNWIAYLALAGPLFGLGLVEIPAGWTLGVGAFRWLGGAFLAAAILYLVFSAVSKRRSWTVLGHELTLPPPRMTWVQLLLGSVPWLAMATIVFILLPPGASFSTVLGVLLLSSIAALFAHVPAGLGVLEAVFVVLLGDAIPSHDIVAAIFTFRAIYYLLPFPLALPLYFWLEASSERVASARTAG